VDTLNGGTGDDIYIVDRVTDVIIETSATDRELVKSSASKYYSGSQKTDSSLRWCLS